VRGCALIRVGDGVNHPLHWNSSGKSEYHGWSEIVELVSARVCVVLSQT